MSKQAAATVLSRQTSLGGRGGLWQESIRPANLRRNLYITGCKSQMCINTRNAKGHPVVEGIYALFQWYVPYYK